MVAPATLFALSTPRGRSAIAVVRLSGPHAGPALESLTGALPAPRRASLRRLLDPQTQRLLDRALVLWLPGPASYTGEDMAEIHIHGGPAVIEGVVRALGKLPGLTPAAAGDFTRRAFENGRMDLTAVEGLADLLAAETTVQREHALAQVEGALAKRIIGWRDTLLRLTALAEAEIDFPDEGLPDDLLKDTGQAIADLVTQMNASLAPDRRGERLRAGFQVALVGPPNVGKSSLLNAIAGRDVAIVSPEPGTTRDWLEVHLDLAGFPVTLIDMAGLRKAPAGSVEAVGIVRAEARARDADLRLFLRESGGWPQADPWIAALARPMDLWVETKSDLCEGRGPTPAGSPALRVSSKTGEGLDALLTAVEDRARTALAPTEEAALTRERHRVALAESRAALVRALEAWSGPPELRAEDLRLALRALGRITGEIDVDQVLDLIFREFCIGK